MRKNWVDLVYWCAQLRDKDTAVCMAIQKIEKNHPTSVVIDQQSFKDHAAGTRAQDAPRILRWLESNGEEYTRTKFHKFLDGLVMFKLCTFHFNTPQHKTGMEFKWEADGKTVTKKFGPHQLVHSDWRMLLLAAHHSLLTWSVLHVACPFTYRVYVPSRLRDRVFRPVDGTNVTRFVSYMYPHPLTESDFNLTYLATQIPKAALTVQLGNATQLTKIRAGHSVPQFSVLYKAKFWQEEAYDAIRRSLVRPRTQVVTAEGSQDGIQTFPIVISGEERTVALVKEWSAVEQAKMQFNVVLVLCNSRTAHPMEGLHNYMSDLGPPKLTVIVIGREPEVRTHVKVLQDNAGGKKRQVAMIPLNIDAGAQYTQWDELFPYDTSTPDGMRPDLNAAHKSLWCLMAVMYGPDVASDKRKLPGTLAYNANSQLEPLVYVTSILEYLVANVLGYAKMKESKQDKTLFNLLVLPACEESDLAQHVTGAFLTRFHTWTATLLVSANAELTQLGEAMAGNTKVKMQTGSQILLGKVAEFEKAVGLISVGNPVSSANLSKGQHTDENKRLAYEVQKLVLKAKGSAEAEWLAPGSRELNQLGLGQLSEVKKAIKELIAVKAGLEAQVQKKDKSPSPKGEKPADLTPIKRSASGEGATAQKKRRVGAGLSKPSVDATDPEVEIDAHLPLKDRLRSSPSRPSPPKPPAKGKGKGKGKGRGKAQGDKPNAARTLEGYPGDEPAATSDDDDASGADVAAPNPSGKNEEGSENDEIEEQ
jgi:hypothetical protein